MAIKSEVVSKAVPVKPFPKLMVSKESGAVILFYAEGRGMVVSGKTKAGKPVGYFSTEWVPAYFEDFNGTLRLSNE